MKFPKIKLFVIFHDKLFRILYRDLKRYRNNVFFIGVKRRISDASRIINKYNVLYQQDLKIQKPELEKYKYFETSTILHAYYNRLHEGCEYVGFAQYDMEIGDKAFRVIEKAVAGNPGIKFIFYSAKVPFENERIGFFCGNSVPYDFIIDSYNRHFGTGYTAEGIRSDKSIAEDLILYSTFVIPTAMFEKIMGWISKFVYELHEYTSRFPPGVLKGRIASIAERSYGLALALESLDCNVRLEKTPITHIERFNAARSMWFSRIRPYVSKTFPFIKKIKDKLCGRP